jgi:hypothetical protein
MLDREVLVHAGDPCGIAHLVDDEEVEAVAQLVHVSPRALVRRGRDRLRIPEALLLSSREREGRGPSIRRAHHCSKGRSRSSVAAPEKFSQAYSTSTQPQILTPHDCLSGAILTRNPEAPQLLPMTIPTDTDRCISNEWL